MPIYIYSSSKMYTFIFIINKKSYLTIHLYNQIIDINYSNLPRTCHTIFLNAKLT